MKDGLSQMIINVEAQKDEPSRYDLLDRAVFYVSRLISSQKERDFVNTNYNDVHLAYDKLIGNHQCKGRLDLLNIVLIGLSNELPEHDEKYGLHRLLGALLSKQLSVDEKLTIIEKEYNIPVESSVRKEVASMCNLSQGIREDARAEMQEEIIINMYKNGFSIEQIEIAVGKSVEEIKAVIEKREPVLA